MRYAGLNYEFMEITEDLLNGTREEWLDQISAIESNGESILVSAYEQTLDWAEKNLNTRNTKDVCTYTLKRTDDIHACAILELSHARKETDTPWLKLLNIRMEPQLDIDQREQITTEGLFEAYKVLGASIVNSLELTFTRMKSKQLKIYARTDEMLGLFDGTLAGLSEEKQEIIKDIGFKLRKEARWLVFDKE